MQLALKRKLRKRRLKKGRPTPEETVKTFTRKHWQLQSLDSNHLQSLLHHSIDQSNLKLKTSLNFLREPLLRSEGIKTLWLANHLSILKYSTTSKTLLTITTCGTVLKKNTRSRLLPTLLVQSRSSTINFYCLESSLGRLLMLTTLFINGGGSEIS